MAGANNIIAMGDDCVNDCRSDPSEFYRRAGVRLTAITKEDDESFSFCSHIYREDGAVPESPIKAFVNLLHNDPNNPMFLMQFMLEMRHLPDINYWVDLYKQCISEN